MILLDAIYVNDGGGRVLLDYLIAELETTDSSVCYLLDSRIAQENYKIKTTNTVFYMKASLWERNKFYKKHSAAFSSILCFGNIPPTTRTKVTVFTYFHQLLFLKANNEVSFSKRILLWLKSKIVRVLKKNTDFWIVQSDLVARQLAHKFNLGLEKIKVLPIFKPLPNCERAMERQRFSYLYVSNATPHKNHIILINAFCKFFDEKKCGKLILTVSNSYSQVFDLISAKVTEGYPITNIGFVSHTELSALYSSSQFLIFPSSTESFGLPLIEAIEMGCKVIAPNLPYVHAVCDPSIVFDEISKESILSALIKSLENDIPDSTAKVENKMKDLLALFK